MGQVREYTINQRGWHDSDRGGRGGQGGRGRRGDWKSRKVLKAEVFVMQKKLAAANFTI